MADREKLAWTGLSIGLIALVVYMIAFWRAPALTTSLLGMTALIWSVFWFGGWRKKPEDERDMAIRLRATWVATNVFLLGLAILYGAGGGSHGSIAGGALAMMTMVAFTADCAARIYFYRRGV